MKRFLSIARIICVLAILSAAALQAGGIFPVNLECDAWQNPLGMDDPNPRLSWQVVATNATERSQSQTAYEIQVASSVALLASNEPDLWDSGRVSGQPFFVTYGGSALASVQRVFWQVRVWDANDVASGYSSVATWTMGLLNPTDWQGSWLVPPASINSGMPIFLRQFKVNPGLQRALVYVCGLGQYELSANGAKVGNALLAPGWSMYPATCLYDTLDLTSQLTNGNNALGVMLGNGMYNVPATTNYTKFTGSFGPPKLMAQIYLFYTNGIRQVIASDTNWVTTNGPITYSHVYGGEYYDARLWPGGWNQAGFAAAGWPAAVVTSGPGGTLRGESHASPHMVAMQTLLPIHTNILAANSLVYDLGQNATIIVSLTTHGPAGAQIVITPAELTNTDGTINRESCGGGTASWQYTLAGTGSESWTSRFFYHGGRYLQVTLNPAAGSSQLPSLDALSGVVIQGASTNTGNFSCSFPLFNNIRTIIRWAQANNLASILTDCPHRERLGWQGQCCPSLHYEYDMRRMVAKAMQDMADSQAHAGTGLVPDIAPEFTVFSGAFRDTPEIGSAVIQQPWQQYLFTGDDTLLRTYYSAMTNYFQYLNGQAVNYFLNYPNGLGDWYDLGPQPEGTSQDTPVSLTADFYYCLDAQTLAQASAELGKTNDAAYFNQLATNIGTAFNKTYYSNGSYGTSSQTSEAMPLYLGIVNPTNQAAVMTSLIANINSQGITTGGVGHRYLLRALTDNGRPDMVYTLHSGTSNPGYGYILSQGATALTEAWDANPSDSQDHFMLGDITEWFYHDLAGIQWDPSAPGFRNIIIKPAFVGGITWVNASYNSAMGGIVSDWALTNSQATLNVAIPVGSTGSIYLPLYGAVQTNVLITESGTSIWQNGRVSGSSPGVTFNRVQTNNAQTYVVWTVASGNYQFAWNVLLPAPATPTGLTATAGNAVVAVNWNSSPGTINYSVQRSTSRSGGYATIASTATANYIDTAVTNGTTYYYEVAAADAYGASTNSSWVSAAPSVSAANQTVYFDFSPTYLAYGTEAGNPSNGAVTINGSSLIAGNVLVCDVLVSNTSGTTSDNWGSVNLNQGGFFGVTGAALGVLARTGTGTDQCLIYTNGVQGANFPGTAEVNSNHLRLTLYVAATGSTTNMGWLAQLDQGLTGSFTSSLSGTNLTFSGNSISLTFSAYQAAVSFVQYPIPVNTSKPTLIRQVAGGQIQFGWPTDHTGWRLQEQTNAPDAGLGSNWVTVSGSTLTNQITLPVSPANGSVFYRLIYP